MAGTLTVDTIQSDSSYNSVVTIPSKVNFTGGMQVGGADATFGGMRNRIINGAMTIDQRYAGTSKNIPANTNGSNFILDRWRFDTVGAAAFTVQQVTDAPSGFVKSMKVTVTTTSTPGADDRYNMMHQTELSNSQDLSGQPISISFWVKSSVTGTYSVNLTNAIGDPYRREYIATYTINSTNTWEYKTITIPAYAWDTGQQTYPNGYGLGIAWALSMGSNRQYPPSDTWYVGGNEHLATTTSTQLTTTNGATWQITGVQVEKGSSATPFEYRNYGHELAMCQRYFYSMGGNSVYEHFATVSQTASTDGRGMVFLPVQMRTSPSIGQTGSFQMSSGLNSVTGTYVASTAMYFNVSVFYGPQNIGFDFWPGTSGSYGGSAGSMWIIRANNSLSTRLTFTAEL